MHSCKRRVQRSVVSAVAFHFPMLYRCSSEMFLWAEKILRLLTYLLYGIALFCIVSIHLYSASCSAHQSEELPVRETQREESSLERTKRGNWHKLIKWVE